MADQQYSQYPAGQASYSYGSCTGDSSYSQSCYGSTNTGAYTVESSFLQLFREKSAIQTQLEEVLKKYKAAVDKMSIDQKTLSEQSQEIAFLEDDRQFLEDQVREFRHKFEHLAGQSEDTHQVRSLDGEVESSFLQLAREKSAIEFLLEDVRKKYKALVQIMLYDKKELYEQNKLIADLQTKQQMLEDQLSEVLHEFEHLVGQSEDTHQVRSLDGKVRDLESKLELEQTTRSRLEDCTICFRPWTSSSEHRLVSLRCGHLFGQSCISRWLEGENARCPQCNARARKDEIINIYAKSIKVLDTSECDKALVDLAKEITARKSAEIIATQECIKHGLAVQENERLKKELMDAQKQLQEFRINEKIDELPQETTCQNSTCQLPSIY